MDFFGCSYLSVYDRIRLAGRQHLVEGVEEEVNVHPEGVLVLTSGRPGEEDPGLDDELRDELEGPETLLDRVLVIGRRRQVGAVSDAADEAPEKNIEIIVAHRGEVGGPNNGIE